MKRSELKKIIKQILVEEGRAPGRPKFTEADVSYGIVFVGDRGDRSRLNYPYDLKGANVKEFYGKAPLDSNDNDVQYYIFDIKNEARNKAKQLNADAKYNNISGAFKILPIADLEDNDNKVFVRPGTLKRALAE
jgi:hypothetical protein